LRYRLHPRHPPCALILDPITLISKFSGMMSGLSPDALCRIFQLSVLIEIKVSFDAIKKFTMSLAAGLH
jgi:hypothetical protein